MYGLMYNRIKYCSVFVCSVFNCNCTSLLLFEIFKDFFKFLKNFYGALNFAFLYTTHENFALIDRKLKGKFLQ